MKQRRVAILVGNGRYPDEEKLQDLRCPPLDVEGLNGILQSPERGAFEETHVLKDKPHHEVLYEINRILNEANKTDLVFLYYSGHGKLDLANHLHLCTVNTTIKALGATSIPVQMVKNFIDQSPARQVTLVLDCCFSGAVGDVFARSGVDDQLQLLSGKGGRGTYIMSASTGVQVALEKEQDDYSVFTKHMIEGIETGAADVNKDGIVTMDELYSYVHDRVLEEVPHEPMKWGINVQGELIIARTGKSPRKERRKKLRQFLLGLASEDTISDETLSTAMKLISKPAEELDRRNKKMDALLDKLESKEIGIGDFHQSWFRLDTRGRRTSQPGRRSDEAATSTSERTETATAGPQPERAAATTPSEEKPAARSPKKERGSERRVQQQREPAPPAGEHDGGAGAVEVSSILQLPRVLWRAVRLAPLEFRGWLGRTVAGLILGGFLGALVFAALDGSNLDQRWFRSEDAAALVAGTLSVGLMMGWMQALKLRRFGLATGPWVAASALGWAAGAWLGGDVGRGLLGGAYVGLGLGAALGGAIAASVVQATQLRAASRNAKWWVRTNVGSWLAGMLVVGVSTGFVTGDGEMALGWAVIGGLLFWILASSAALAWLVREGNAGAAIHPEGQTRTPSVLVPAMTYALALWLSLFVFGRTLAIESGYFLLRPLGLLVPLGLFVGGEWGARRARGAEHWGWIRGASLGVLIAVIFNFLVILR